MSTDSDLTFDQYRDLAEFRRQIRRFLHFSEVTAKEHGLEAQQHQLLLAVHGLPDGTNPTIREIASRLFIQHHSAVELIDRLEKQGAVSRQHGEEDRREVLLHLTPRGEDWLRRLTVSIWPQLQVEGVALSDSLKKLLAASKEQGREPR